MPTWYLFSFTLDYEVGNHSALKGLCRILRYIENRRAKWVFLDTLGFEVFDEEEEGDNSLLVGEQLSEKLATL